VSELLLSIANASTEQTQGIDRIGHAMTSIEESTQQTMAMVEESAASTELLDQQANRLTSVVATFKLGVVEPPSAEPHLN